MIVREGVRPLAVIGVAAAVAHVTVGVWATVALGVLMALALALYWERRPPLPSEPKSVLSPVRGTVLDVAPTRDPWLERDALRIRIGLDAPGIVPVRAPIEGKVMEFYTARGVLGEEQRACRDNESPDCYVSWIRSDEDEDVVYALSSRWPLSRARFRQSPGERVGHGKHSGFVYFASVADVLLPAASLARIAPGDEVMAGADVLAQLR